jgi:hypothetical protein
VPRSEPSVSGRIGHTNTLDGIRAGWYNVAVTIPEAARQLGLAEATLRLQVRLGKLHAVKRGRDYWVEPKEVARYAAEHRRVKA